MVDRSDQESGLISTAPGERTVFRTITEKTADWVVEDLQRLGYERDKFDMLDPNHSQAHNFKDLEIEIKCDHETYQGKTREKWNFAWGGGLEFTPLETKEIGKLNALFGKKLRPSGYKMPDGKASTKGSTKTATKDAPSHDMSDDGIPF
jgi:hypothetical protein